MRITPTLVERLYLDAKSWDEARFPGVSDARRRATVELERQAGSVLDYALQACRGVLADHPEAKVRCRIALLHAEADGPVNHAAVREQAIREIGGGGGSDRGENG